VSASESDEIAPPPTDDQIDYIARRFHELYEEWAPTFDYRTRPESVVPWDDVPWANQSLMRYVVRRLIIEGTMTA
jgi:hypothetical protein